MTASLAGNAAAHRVLLDHLSGRVRAYYKRRLARIGRDAAEAEDLVQEALIAIHTGRHTYDPAEPFTPWAHAIARYKLVDHLRRTRASFADASIDDAADVMAQDDHVGVESAYDLQRLLARLPEKMRRAIACVKVEGMSVAETARLCGVSGVESAGCLDRAREEEMRTDDLIAMLSTNVEPVHRWKLARTFGAALVLGGVAAVTVVLLGFGLRTDLTSFGQT